LRRTTRHANPLGFDTDQLPLIRNNQDLTLVAHWKHRDDEPVAIAGPHIDHAFAASRRDTILAELSAFTKTVLGNRQHLSVVGDRRDTYHIVGFLQRNSSHTRALASLRAKL